MTIFIDRDATQIHADWLKDLCIHCSRQHDADCYARWCSSCTRMWMSDIAAGGDGVPKRETCPECEAWECSPEVKAVVDKFFPEAHVPLDQIEEAERIKAALRAA